MPVCQTKRLRHSQFQDGGNYTCFNMSTSGFKRTLSYVEANPSKKRRMMTRSTSGKYKRKSKSPFTLYRNVGGPELKAITNVIGQFPINTAGELDLVNAIGLGTSDSTMSGNKATLRSITYNYTVLVGATSVTNITSAAANNIRVCLIYDNACNGILPTIADMFTNQGADSTRNLQNAERFTVLYDQVHAVGCWGVATTGGCFSAGPISAVAKVYKSMSLPYCGPSVGGIAGVQQGAIYAVSLCTTIGNAQVTGTVRVRYTDN